jgi:3-oxoacyl-[acyl-carrier protein] reductase
MSLNGKVAIVTGSSRGIGAATAILLAQNGALVTVNYKNNREAGENILGTIKNNNGKGILVQADVTDPAQIKKMVEKTERELGPIDI